MVDRDDLTSGITSGSASELPGELDASLAAGRAAYPAVAVTPALAAFVAERLAAIEAAHDPTARAADVVLAGACAAGDPAALAIVDAGLAASVRPALARLGVPAADDDELVQRLRIALLAPGEGARGIAGYAGRGDLRAFVRAVAVKLALKRLTREAGPATDDDVLDMLPDAGDSPELRVLKERCRGDLRSAFATALAALTPHERTLLRQHYLDGLSIDALAPLHRVHRATCARWLETARASVLRGVRRHLQATLALGAGELDSAVDLVRSQLDLSLARHLAT